MNTRARQPEAWFEKAEHDLLAIRNNLAGTSVPWDVVAFHAQQAAEKYLKGFLVARLDEVPKIHDLVTLLARCITHDVTLADLNADCERLTRIGWLSRYPDTPDEPDEADARVAIEIAQRVRLAIRQRVSVAGAE
jgi:HEPN domain-containing protein